MSMRLILATDNGFIVVREPNGTYKVIFDYSDLFGSPASHSMGDYLLGGFSGHPEYCSSMVTYRNAGHKAPDRDEWIEDAGEVVTYNDGNPPFQSNGMNLQTIVGPDGIGYIHNNYHRVGDPSGTFNGWDLYKSTDRTLSNWVLVADLYTTMGADEEALRGMRDVVIEDGTGGPYFWWLSSRQYQPGNPVPRPDPRLCRMNLDGTGFTYWAIDWSPLDIDMVDTSTYAPKFYEVKGQWQTNRIIASSAPNFGSNMTRHASNPSISGCPPILSIDVSDPDNPTWQFGGSGGTVWEPFGGVDTHYAVDVRPLNNSVILAHIWEGIPGTSGTPRHQHSGAIMRSTDAGMTWTTIVAFTRHLASARDSLYPPWTTTFPHDQGLNWMQTMAVMPNNYNEIAVANASPWVWFSHDGGLTWEEETVPDSIYDDYLPLAGDPSVQPNTPPYNWTGVIWGCANLMTQPVSV